MAVLMPNSVFICIPKTGTQTVRQALVNARISQVEVGPTELWEGQAGLSQIRHASYWQVREFCRGRQVIASIRPTLEWYQSVWCHRKSTGEEGLGLISSDNWRENFGDWIRWNCAATRSPYGTFLCQVLDGSQPALLRTESILHDLSQALELAGEDFVPKNFLHTQAKNRSPLELKDQCRYSADLIQQVQAAEGSGTYPHAFMQQYEDRFVGRLLSESSL